MTKIRWYASAQRVHGSEVPEYRAKARPLIAGKTAMPKIDIADEARDMFPDAQDGDLDATWATGFDVGGHIKSDEERRLKLENRPRAERCTYCG
jgi:hypothetical protein